MLPVFFDDGHERFRTLDEAVPMLREVEFDDWPIAGPRPASFVCRQLRREGRSFLQQGED